MPATASPSDAPDFIEPLSWVILIVSIILISIGILYGLKRWGEPPDDDVESDGLGVFHTTRAGPRGWSGNDAQGLSRATELHRLLDVQEEDEEDNGESGSETTAVEGNLPGLPSGAAPSAAGRWKLRREGFSTTSKEFQPKSSGRSANRQSHGTPSAGTGWPPRHSRGISIRDALGGEQPAFSPPTASSKDD
ncbi:hypothetical protein K437DRAFT_266636 [Tilletiaria anomala UBC 951]|uniref:Uncharacterized protein n=1 Tax=Tilletiaria anomala (strain ATCC 24038 / CBS 436.72 / UBC 951) TaxID=1037660 RepID=A0A066WPA3_TILAU|nr:uncharacterized protein K437DRAFT_266636 [Tilletiaria anomala UBC 951]KDN52450.1 hypothetical protein K437DRAFT_266636 [Tilletiaria anomala UBC 951]